MANTAVESGPRLIAFVLPSVPESVPVARFHVRATLGFHGLGEYANDVETITSELVTNAVRHVCDDGTETIGIALARAWNPAAVTVIVSDSSPEGPIWRDVDRQRAGPGTADRRSAIRPLGLAPARRRKSNLRDPRPGGMTVMADLSDLPMLHDIDADYTPQYVKLARVLRDKIESGKYHRGDILPAADLAHEHNVSIRVTYAALAMLAANRYVDRPVAFTSYSVIWQAAK